MQKKKRAKKVSFLPGVLGTAGKLCIGVAVFIVLLTYGRILWQELSFTVRSALPVTQSAPSEPVDRKFGIVIDKIGANAKVIPDVDPYNSRIYQVALTRGVAHAKGTGLPGQAGNIFLFSHSSVNFYEASRYNSVFYLLTKLEEGDGIELWYNGTKYDYVVMKKTVVPPTSVEYLKPLEPGRETVTLMTCWPPGTTYKRLLVIAERAE